MLYLVATPIGNLGDISYRAVETLRLCDAVFCEDTRRTAQLLHHLQIEKPLFSLHEHNERQKSEQVIERLRQGQTVVYVSDAGMPAISDPGALLVEACIEHGLAYTVVPGASAVLTAAILSGLPPQPMTFFGFLPRENQPRRNVLEQLKCTPHQCILYESPHRVQSTLQELSECLGDCRAAVLRELTKKYETVYRGTLGELIPQFATEPKGECVIAVLPEPERQAELPDADTLLKELLISHSVKDAAAIAAQRLRIPKKEAYARALELKE